MLLIKDFHTAVVIDCNEFVMQKLWDVYSKAEIMS